MKKAIFFTIDSLLASGIIIVSILLVSNFYISEHNEVNVNYASQDLVRVFSSLTIGEVRNDYAKNLIASGQITNPNNTLIEQIGQFWSENNVELAKNLTINLTEAIIPKNYGFSIIIDDEVIYSRNIPLKKALVSSRRLISGIAKLAPTEGFTSRIILKGIQSKRTNAYAYFGGYEGDGNLTKRMTLPTSIESFNSSYIEVDAGGNFNLYINNVFSGSYTKGSGGGSTLIPDKWNISNAYLANFRPGLNIININFTSGNNYVAGGFLRLTYITSSYNDTQTFGYEKYYFPGIDGIINLYSSIYAPGAVNNMIIFLNFSSNYTAFLKLGNTTVYDGSTNGTIKNVTISNSTLSTLIDYNSFNQKTVPLRLGLKDISFLKGGNADVILITDVSGSMDWRLDSTSTGITRACNDPLLYDPSTKRISLAKCLDAQFIDVILNSSIANTTNRIGLVAYSGLPNSIPTASSVIIRINHSLSNNNASLKNQINSYTPSGATGVCGSIRDARAILEKQSNSSRNKFIIVMTDGIANVQCSLADEYSTTGCIPRTCPDNSFCAGGGCLQSQCGDWVSYRASNDSIQDACRAYNTTNATVYSIGFGPVSTCDIGNQTLKGIATCGKGAFYSSGNATELVKIYNDVAQQILNASFTEQIVNVTFALNTKLFSGSYIEFNYTPPSETQFNKIPLTFETERFNNNISTGTLVIYPNTSILDARVTSYSGSKWTDNLIVNGNNVYRLSSYGNSYQELGDPFAVSIPISSLNPGNNTITISAGTSPTNSTGGSADNRVIYTLLLNAFSDYTAVVGKSDGCSWAVAFEDGTALTIKVPQNYNGADVCSFATDVYDPNDALDIAAYGLFNNLDFDKDKRLDVNIDQNNLEISTLTITKVPSLWGPAVIEINVWE